MMQLKAARQLGIIIESLCLLSHVRRSPYLDCSLASGGLGLDPIRSPVLLVRLSLLHQQHALRTVEIMALVCWPNPCWGIEPALVKMGLPDPIVEI